MQNQVKNCYNNAISKGAYPKNIYIGSNADEYWAESTQAWFEATVRTDVTGGVRTKHELAERDPELAKVMLRVYGGNTWVYPDSAPKKFRAQPPNCTRVPPAEIARRLGVPAPAAPLMPPQVASAMHDARAKAHIGKRIAEKVWGFVKTH
jgi:hypothetical protein